jgi:hypothetical protein
MRTVLAGVVFVLAVGIGSVIPASPPYIPACPEDAVLIGEGDFVAGRWSSYVCGPAADDLGVQ